MLVRTQFWVIREHPETGEPLDIRCEVQADITKGTYADLAEPNYDIQFFESSIPLTADEVDRAEIVLIEEYRT